MEDGLSGVIGPTAIQVVVTVTREEGGCAVTLRPAAGTASPAKGGQLKVARVPGHVIQVRAPEISQAFH